MMLLFLMPVEETGETRVRTDCLNFDASLCIQIKTNFNLRKKALGLYFLLDWRSRCCSRMHVSERSTEYVTSVMKNVLSNKKIIQMLMFALQKKIWKTNY